MRTEAALQELDPQECWALLMTQRVGRLAFSDRALPTIRPLNYVVHGHRIVLRVSAKGLGERLDGQVVAFEVDDSDVVGQMGWSVVVTGTLRLQERTSEQLRTLSVPSSWAGEGHQDVAVLSVGEITGRRVRASA